MDNYKDALDDKVREALQNLEMPYEPSSWARLAARLDAPSQATPSLTDTADTDAHADVDEAVRKTLQQIEVPFQAAHWARMEKRLTTIKTLTRRIYSAKISEAAIILLALLNWGNLLIEKPDVPKVPVFDPNVPVASAPVRSKTAPLAHASMKSETSNQAESAAQLNAIVGESKLNSTNKRSATLASAGRGLTENSTYVLPVGGSSENASTVVAMETVSSNLADQQGVELENQFSTLIQNQTAKTELVAGLEESKMQAEALEQASNVETLVAANPLTNLEDNATMSIMLLNPLPTNDMALLQNQVEGGLAKAKVDKFKALSQRYVATFAAAESNKVRTPYDPISRNAGYTQTETGVGAGVLYGKKQGKWAVETGIAYSSIHYNPRPRLNGGRVELALNEVNFETVSIPVRAVRSLGKHKRLSIKAFAGVNMSLIAEANYGYKTYVPSSPDPQPPVALERENGKGLFEGGSLADNSYLNIETGLRFEHSISATNRWKLFLEPHYRADIMNNNGTGPNRDRLSALSMRAGVITVL